MTHARFTEQPGRIRIAVLRDAAEAERWQAALEDAGVEADIEIDDLQQALPGQSVPGILGAAKDGFAMFAYLITIRAADHERTAEVLTGLGWNGRVGGERARAEIPVGTLVRGTCIALALGAAALLLRIALQ